jgi:hypothetical protein
VKDARVAREHLLHELGFRHVDGGRERRQIHGEHVAALPVGAAEEAERVAPELNELNERRRAGTGWELRSHADTVTPWE